MAFSHRCQEGGAPCGSQTCFSQLDNKETLTLEGLREIIVPHASAEPEGKRRIPLLLETDGEEETSSGCSLPAVL